LKDALRRHCSASDELKHGVHEGLRSFGSEFDATQLAYSVSFKVGKSVFIKEETLWKVISALYRM
jgi:hypothetical protein